MISTLNSKDTKSCRYEPCSNRYELSSTTRVFFGDRIGTVVGTTIILCSSAVRLSCSGSFIDIIRLILHLLNNLQLSIRERIICGCFFLVIFDPCIEVNLLECLWSKLIYRRVEELCATSSTDIQVTSPKADNELVAALGFISPSSWPSHKIKGDAFRPSSQ